MPLNFKDDIGNTALKNTVLGNTVLEKSLIN